jgi:hypothetical protein
VLALGAILVLRFGHTPRAPRSAPPPAVVFTVVVLAVAAFWAATTYARDIGEGAARGIEQDPRRIPVATVYSGRPLDLPGATVSATRYQGPDGEWLYRYTGARVLTYSNERWFLLVEDDPQRYRASVIVLRDTEDVRVRTSVPR